MIYIASKIISYRFVSDKSVAHQLIYQRTDGPNLIEMVDNFSCRLTVSMFMYLFITVSKKSQKLKIFAISQFWFVGVVGQKIAVATSNSIYILFGPLLAPIPNFIQIGWKAQKLKIFAIGRFWLVGVVGQKIAVATSNSIYVLFGPLLAPIPNFIQIG